MVWIMKNIIVRYFVLIGQHKDNEAVIEYLVEECRDIEWIVHGASIIVVPLFNSVFIKEFPSGLRFILRLLSFSSKLKNGFRLIRYDF